MVLSGLHVLGIAIGLDGAIVDGALGILRAHRIAQRLVAGLQLHRIEQFRLAGAHRVGGKARRRLHGDEREQLEQMVRHHVAQRAGRVVIIAAAADGQRFGDRDLHVIDMVAIPDRLEQAVGKAQHQNVLHRLLAEIMIDAKNLILAENAEQFAIERPRRSEIGAERLFDDDASPCAVCLTRQPRLAEMAADRRKTGRRRGQIEQPVAVGLALALDAGELAADFFVSLRIVRIALHIGDAGEKLLHGGGVDLAGGELRQAFLEVGAEGLAR